MRKNKQSSKYAWKQRLSEDIQIPQNVISGAVKMNVGGNQELWIENYKGILEFSEERILIQCMNYKVRILGAKLHIEYYSDTDCLIVGNLEQIHFLQ